MFCDEEIKAVYYGYRDDKFENNDCYFDFLHNMILYLTEGNRLILETDNYILSVFNNDVVKSIKESSAVEPGSEKEYIRPCCYADDETDDVFTGYEHTLFCGEKLTAVEKREEQIQLIFDDFKVGVMSFDKFDMEKSRSTYDGINVLGAERLITRKCSCGGTGKLQLDFVYDYGVNCDRCNLGTWDSMCACDAINDWNENNEVHDKGYRGEKSFFKNCMDPIDRICVKNDFIMYDSNLLDCDSIIVDMKSHKYEITVKYLYGDVFDFSFSEVSDYNPEIWSRKIISTEEEPVKFVCKRFDGDDPVLYFKIGERPLVISIDEMMLTVGLSGYDENDNRINYNNDEMFNDK